MSCPANVTPEKWGGGGWWAKAWGYLQAEQRLEGAHTLLSLTRHQLGEFLAVIYGCPAWTGAFGSSFSDMFNSGHLITGCKDELFQNTHVPVQKLQ